MTEPDDTRTTLALRDMLTERVGTLTAPAGVYETVRRRHRRRQRATVGGALVLALVAIGVPAVALTDRPPAPAPAATAPSCSFPGVRAPLTKDRLPAPRDVPGSLGGDAAVVSAVLAQGWAGLRAGDAERQLDPGTARVLMAERVEGQVVAIVAADGKGRRRIDETWVWGPDARHLVTRSSGGAAGSSPLRTRYAIGDVFLVEIEICAHRYVALAAAPGTTGRITSLTAITPELRAVQDTRPVPLRPDGIAVFRSDAGDVRLRLERAGRVVWNTGFQSWNPLFPGLTDAEIRRIALAAPGDGSRGLVATILGMGFAGSLPVRPSDQRVLWTGRVGRATVAVPACTLPGGITYVVPGAAVAGGSLLDSGYGGLVAPGALGRTVLAWRLTQSADALAVYAAGGVRAEAVLAGGAVVPFRLSGGGGVLPSPGAVRLVRAYDAGGRLIGEQVPGAGLTPLPHLNPI